jgi:flagellar basal-body rod modification protein FlgD
MSTVNSLSSLFTNQTAPSTSSTSTSTSTSSDSTATVDTSDFLQLLVAQLQNQDPLNPIDNQDFVTQLATFSSLQQLISINTAVTKLADGTS